MNNEEVMEFYNGRLRNTAGLQEGYRKRDVEYMREIRTAATDQKAVDIANEWAKEQEGRTSHIEKMISLKEIIDIRLEQTGVLN